MMTSSKSTQSAPQEIMAEMLLKDASDAFKVWHHVYERSEEYAHGSEEYHRRFTYFKKMLTKVNAHNADETKTWKETVSIFADRSPEEMAQIFRPNNDFPNIFSKPVGGLAIDIQGFFAVDPMYTKSAVSAAIDWTSYTGPVYNQQQCGCCYAFASSNAIESNYNIKYGKSITISRQQIVDCSVLTSGCNGGNMSLAMAYLWSAGAMSNTVYPFQGSANSACQSSYNSASAAKYVKHIITPNSSNNSTIVYDDTTLYALLKQGAVAVAIDGSIIQSYSSGIMDPTCSQNNHAVLLVGYNPTGDYWIIKNQWNTTWGESGYLRLKRRNDGLGNCYIETAPILTVIE